MTAQPKGEPVADADTDPTTDGASTVTDETSTTSDTESGTDDVPEATLWPSDGRESESDPDTVVIDVYIVTGRHGGLRIPESFCRECDLFVRAADVAAENVDLPVDVRVYSWWTRFPWAIRHGGYHPPVMVVGGKKLCQGHTVPSPEEVTEAIEAAAANG